MLLELLEMSNRRNTILSEVVRFFRRTEGMDARKQTESFLRTFTGTTVEMEAKGTVTRLPAPPELKLLWRDEQIAKTIVVVEQDLANSPGQTIARRIELMKLNSIDFAYLDEIYKMVAKRHLAPPPSRTRAQAVEDAAELIKRHGATRVENLKGVTTRLQESICAMYALTVDERARAITLATRKPTKKKK